MIQMKQTSLRYQNGMTAVSAVTLHVAKGSFYYLTGRSGAGKSSLLKMIYGGVRPSSGQLVVLDTDLRQAPTAQIRQLRQRIGVIFQDHKLLFDRTVFENVALPLRVQGWDMERIAPHVRKALQFVELMDDRVELKNDRICWSFPSALSGGEQQRVAIARAICAKPPLILADEPTGNLDYETACKIVGYLTNLHKFGTTVLMATHDYQMINRFPSSIIHMQQGAVQEILDPLPPQAKGEQG